MITVTMVTTIIDFTTAPGGGSRGYSSKKFRDKRGIKAERAPIFGARFFIRYVLPWS